VSAPPAAVRDGPVEVDGRMVELSNTGKVLYPDTGATKGDVIAYYRDVADVMVPHLRGRPLTLRRFPNGLGAPGFYQKDASAHFPSWIRTVAVARRADGGTVDHVLCDDAATLLYLANLACLEHHVWPTRADALDRPDRLIIDIDPPPDADLAEVRDTARRLRDLYEAVGLVPAVQTTGGAGYHVVAPLDRTADVEVVRDLARDLAAHLAAARPDRLTVEIRKGKRRGRILLDTGRNAYGQMGVSPYSLRARPGAPVATPVDWSELGRVAPASYHLGNVRRRLARKGDPWADLDVHAGSGIDARRRLAELPPPPPDGP
jgi:bifunctional non-homologous end joining protein LigD